MLTTFEAEDENYITFIHFKTDLYEASILSTHMERMGLISDSIKSYFTFNIELLYMMINQ